MNQLKYDMAMDAISKFNWEVAAQLFLANGWTYLGEDESPDAERLKANAQWQGYLMAKEDGAMHSSGRVALCVTGSQVNVFVGLCAWVSDNDPKYAERKAERAKAS